MVASGGGDTERIICVFACDVFVQVAKRGRVREREAGNEETRGRIIG